MKSLRNPNRKPTHPGAVLREDVLPELGLTQTELANRLMVRPGPLLDIDPLLLKAQGAGLATPRTGHQSAQPPSTLKNRSSSKPNHPIKINRQSPHNSLDNCLDVRRDHADIVCEEAKLTVERKGLEVPPQQ
jgi:hypothetical protein